ncbi:MAG: T9SS type A sorting domain-containing protein [Ignavibacteriae bacterium]|nr:T9SS type A sorting domain-containing protein [Ignavibacteriota bacterium]MCB9215026.1 T9SS type A sorting domain-containing protein [Ignavibacteria bacterium]
MMTSRQRILSFLLITGFVVVSVTSIAAQTIDSCIGGTLYYIAFPDTVTNAQDVRFASSDSEEFLLYIYSPVDQQVQIDRAGIKVNVDLQAGEIREFNTKEVEVPLVTTLGRSSLNVLKVEAEVPIVVYAYMVTNFGCAAFTPIPVDAWGREYFAATWEGGTVTDFALVTLNDVVVPIIKVPAPAQILIIAAYDGTEVTLYPTGELLENISPVQVRLNAGDVYLAQSFVDTLKSISQPDIAGSRIVASRPIGVLTGNTRLLHDTLSVGSGLLNNSLKDMAVEWVAPVDQHGTEFVFLPTWDVLRQELSDAPSLRSRDREYVRVYGTTENETEVTYAESDQNLNVPAFTTPVKGGEYSHEVITGLQNGRSYRTSERGQAYQSPQSLIQFDSLTGGGKYVGAHFNSWGSYMVEMVPREEWGTFAPFRAPTYPAAMNHYVNVVTDTLNESKIFYRRGTSTPQLFSFNRGRIPGTDLVWGILSIEPGVTFTVEGSEGARFSGFVYGSAVGSESYRPTASISNDNYHETTAMMYGFPLVAPRCSIPNNTSHVEEGNSSDRGYGITEIVPNPVAKSTTIRFQLREEGQTEIALMNYLGQRVKVIRNEVMTAGEHNVNWRTEDILPGLYYLQITSKTWRASRKVTLIR